MALEYAWTIINLLEGGHPIPSPNDRDAHLQAIVRETVTAYYELERTKERRLKFPLKSRISDPLPRPSRYWETRRITPIGKETHKS